MITTLFFDVFGTLVNMNNAERSELKAYLNHIQQPKWESLVLPNRWRNFPIFKDVRRNWESLRSRYNMVALTNAPLPFTIQLSSWNKISWDAIVPLEVIKAYKPKMVCYDFALDLLGIENPQDAVMVTANKTFGDLEGANAVGMQSFWIDRDGGENLYDLCDWLDEQE